MSAYIVDDVTINRVVTFIFDNNRAYGDKYYYTLGGLRELGYLSNAPGQDVKYAAKRLAEEMFTLNCDSVEQRYEAGCAETFRPLDFQYRTTPCYKVHQVLKSLACFLYQACEGSGMDSALYKALEQVKYRTAWNVVSNSEDYDKLDWK